jgi:hypothetical protein
MDAEKNVRVQEISDVLNKIFLPLLLALGLIGNMISIYVFSRESMKKHTTFRYLLLLSIIDICTLLTGCGDNFVKVYTGVNVRYLSEFFCKTHSFMVYFFTQSSSLLLACMSVDRAFVISIKKSKKPSTTQAVYRIFVIVLVFVALINFHFLIFPQLITVEVDPSSESASFINDNNNNNNNNDSVSSYTNLNVSDVATSIRMPRYNITYCYAISETTYYTYLTHISPW